MFSFAVLILESKSMGAIFQKRAKYLKIYTKMYKIWKYFEKWRVIETVFNRNLIIMIFENHARSALVKYSIVLLIKDMGLDDTWT